MTSDRSGERRGLADTLERLYRAFDKTRGVATGSEGADAWDAFSDACEANLPTILAALRAPDDAGGDSGRDAGVGQGRGDGG